MAHRLTNIDGSCQSFRSQAEIREMNCDNFLLMPKATQRFGSLEAVDTSLETNVVQREIPDCQQKRSNRDLSGKTRKRRQTSEEQMQLIRGSLKGLASVAED